MLQLQKALEAQFSMETSGSPAKRYVFKSEALVVRFIARFLIR